MTADSRKIFDYYCYNKNIGISINEKLVEDIEFTERYSKDFEYVDGEEGDNGEIFIYHNNILIAVHTIYGGDSEDIEFTRKGEIIMKNLLSQIFYKILNTL